MGIGWEGVKPREERLGTVECAVNDDAEDLHTMRKLDTFNVSDNVAPSKTHH